MDVLVERCAGVDVHRDNVVATVRVPGTGRRRVDQQTRTFAATLGGLAQLAGWLAGFGVTRDRDGGHRRVLEDRLSGARDAL